AGEDDQHLGADFVGEQSGSAVFVDDDIDAFERAVGLVVDRDTAAAGRDHDDAGVDELLDDAAFDDRPGDRRGDDAAPAAIGVFLHGPAAFGLEEHGLLLGVVLADVLGRILHFRIIAVDRDLRDDRDAVAAQM